MGGTPTTPTPLDGENGIVSPPKPEKKGFKNASFYGTVIVAHWIKHKDGQQYDSVTGMVTVKDASDVWGFKVGRSESSWMAVVSGKNETAYIPGNEVYMIMKHSKNNVTNKNTLIVE